MGDGSDADARRFAVRCGEVQLKITLDAKWQRKPFDKAVVEPFIRSYNKKKPDDTVHADGLVSAVADAGFGCIDPSKPAGEAVAAGVSVVTLTFGPKDVFSEPRAAWVSCRGVELKIGPLEPRWLRRPFGAVVIERFVQAYNARADVPAPIGPAELSGVVIDGEALDAADAAAAPTAQLVGPATRTIALLFGRDAPGAREGVPREPRSRRRSARSGCGASCARSPPACRRRASFAGRTGG